MSARPPRPAARILLVDRAGRALLFRFDPPGRAPFWCTPGGALDPGESYDDAARRELLEETGIVADPGAEVAAREVEFTTVEGTDVIAQERYYRIATDAVEIDPAGHTELERRTMRSWRWFARDEIAGWPETIWPADLRDLLDATEPADAR